jgi:hypothetical protein
MEDSWSEYFRPPIQFVHPRRRDILPGTISASIVILPSGLLQTNMSAQGFASTGSDTLKSQGAFSNPGKSKLFMEALISKPSGFHKHVDWYWLYHITLAT